MTARPHQFTLFKDDSVNTLCRKCEFALSHETKFMKVLYQISFFAKERSELYSRFVNYIKG